MFSSRRKLGYKTRSSRILAESTLSLDDSFLKVAPLPMCCFMNISSWSMYPLRPKGGGKRGHIVADTLLLMMFLGWANGWDTKHLFCVHAAQTGKHFLRTQNVSDKNQKHFLCVGQHCVVVVQHCVLVCHHLNGAEMT